MASEYLKKKYQDVKPEEKRELTPSEKRKNWWYYHKWHVAAVIVLISIFGSIIWNAAHQIKPDYQFAYIGKYALPDDTAAAAETALASLGGDLNGDGRVVVRIMQFTTPRETDIEASMASSARLMADLTECESYFFLLEDPDQFQKDYHVLRRLDGSLPDENDNSTDGLYLSWGQCPILAGLDLGEYAYTVMGETISGSSGELMSKLSIARRGFWTEKTSKYPEGCDALWSKITEGAIS